ncbi:uncharacterized protein M6B38_202905 [Iris pallida]|uniref:Uncharacterized protein n=1 Tax=Iris pallida TaxID=29817 RepID=A0AAX6E7Z5_IRIPA|nr:uncharacterized protein M6B38_233700 [Iris pallida]KAJ6800247.1 uncharacterized protein M6B38_202905 [Iris pallida]
MRNSLVLVTSSPHAVCCKNHNVETIDHLFTQSETATGTWNHFAKSFKILEQVSSLNQLAEIQKYCLVMFFNVTMWGCYVNSLKALSSLQATVTNFAFNFLCSGLAGHFLFEEPLPSRVIYINRQ